MSNRSNGFDHLVIAAHDLDGLAGFYRAVGLQVGERNRHDWGTLNHIIQFDGAFLELIGLEQGFVSPSTAQAHFPFSGFLERFLARHQGLAMVVRPSGDANREAIAWQDAGVSSQRFDFSRSGVDAHGDATQVAFSLAFAQTDALSDAGFFVCQQHNPDNFWLPSRQVHDNTATAIAAAVLVVPDPGAVLPFLAQYAAAQAQRVDADEAVIDLGAGSRIDVVTPARAFARYGDGVKPALDDLCGGRFVASHIACTDLAKVQEVLETAGIEPLVADRRVVVLPDVAYGQVLVFEAH